MYDQAVDVWNNLRESICTTWCSEDCTTAARNSLSPSGDHTIRTYFTEFKVLWDEYDRHCPLPACSCGFNCECSIFVVARQQRDLVKILVSLGRFITMVWYKELMAHLQHSKSYTISQASTSTQYNPLCSGTTLHVSTNVDQWILDTGATSHICCYMSTFSMI